MSVVAILGKRNSGRTTLANAIGFKMSKDPVINHKGQIITQEYIVEHMNPKNNLIDLGCNVLRMDFRTPVEKMFGVYVMQEAESYAFLDRSKEYMAADFPFTVNQGLKNDDVFEGIYSGLKSICGSDTWIKYMENQYEGVIKSVPDDVIFVIDDLEDVEEALWVKEKGGVIIRCVHDEDPDTDELGWEAQADIVVRFGEVIQDPSNLIREIKALLA